MKLSHVVTAVAVAATSLSLGAQSAREIAYDANADALQLPNNTYLGEVAGVATNSRGQVFVYTRTGHAFATLGDERTFYHGGSRLFQFDQNGKFIREIGQGTYAMNFAQQARVDPQDNLWVVDAGSNMLMKFDSDGRLLMVLGRKPESINVRQGPGVPARVVDGPPAPPAEGGRGGRGNAPPPGTGIPGDAFNRPSDVTWDRTGNVYVADGFGTNNMSPTRATTGSRCSTGRVRSSRRSPASARRRRSASRADRRSISTLRIPTIRRAWTTARSTSSS
jgi:hypothetical protein